MVARASRKESAANPAYEYSLGAIRTTAPRRRCGSSSAIDMAWRDWGSRAGCEGRGASLQAARPASKAGAGTTLKYLCVRILVSSVAGTTPSAKRGNRLRPRHRASTSSRRDWRRGRLPNVSRGLTWGAHPGGAHACCDLRHDGRWPTDAVILHQRSRRPRSQRRRRSTPTQRTKTQAHPGYDQRTLRKRPHDHSCPRHVDGVWRERLDRCSTDGFVVETHRRPGGVAKRGERETAVRASTLSQDIDAAVGTSGRGEPRERIRELQRGLRLPRRTIRRREVDDRGMLSRA